MALITQAHQPAGEISPTTVEAASRGDRAAVDEFVTWAWSRAKRVAYLLTQNLASAEDVAQDAVLSAIAALPQVDSSRPLRPWLERIAANKTIDLLRKQNVRREETYDEVIHELPEQDVDVLADTIRAAISEDLMAALRNLSPDQRSAVVLRHLLDLKPKEIGEILGIPSTTVRSHVHRGLKNLRTALEPKGDQ